MGSSWTWADLELGSPGTCCISLCKCVLTGPGNRVLVRHTHSLSLSLCWSPLVTTAGLMGDGLLMDLGRPGIGLSRDLSLLHFTLQVCSDWSWQQSTGQAHTHSLSLLVTTGHHCWSNGGWAPHGPGQSTPGTSHCCISLCKCVLTGPGNRVLVRHTHSLSLCWSPLVTTGHHSGLMGDGLLMDLGTPGIGHSRGPATEYWSAHCSPLSLSAGHSTPWTWAGLWNWALWAGLWNWHGPGLVCGIGHSGLVYGIGMDLGWSVELGTLGWSMELAWTWAGLWNWALHGPGLVCGIAHSGLVCGIGHSMDLGCLHPGPSGIRGSMGLGFVVPLDMGHSKDLGVAGSPQLSLTLLH